VVRKPGGIGSKEPSCELGLLAAQNLCKGTRYNLWAINTDYEYQEMSRITETGLIQIV
jgi:hypothetical protein